MNEQTEDEKWKKDKAVLNFKQHANKIIQALEKLDVTSRKKAIWELLQNAVDVSDGNCEIIVKQTESSLDFSHNGKPFTRGTLYSLIIQVSSKGNQNEDEVGQYGTGFLTTHSFGTKILLSGSLDLEWDEPTFIHFENFLIDRGDVGGDWHQLVEKLRQQEKQSDKLVDDPKKKEPAEWTTFSFQTETDSEKEYAQQAIDKLPILLPYVMTINEKLKKVTVIDSNKKSIVYKKDEKDTLQLEDDLAVTSINIDQENIGQEKKTIYSICDDDVTVILPLSEKNTAIQISKEIPKLFLFYPLIGTENFGFNYIVHSKKFDPTEPRDGIHLKSNNPQIANKEKNNREILIKVFNMVTNFVSKNYSVINSQYLAIINFNAPKENEFLFDYFKDLRKTWFDAFKNIPLVKNCNNEFITPLNTHFLGQELLEDKYFDAIYAIVNIFWTDIPKKEIAKDWKNIAVQWEGGTEKREIKFLSIKQVLEKIQDVKTLHRFAEKNAVEHLQNFYTYLISKDKLYFENYVLLPNIKDEFRKQSELRDHSDIPDIFVEVADKIMPEIPKKFIKNGFEFGLHKYGKKEYSEDINNAISKFDISIEKPMPDEKYQALITYCTIFNTSQDNSNRRKLIALICKYQNQSSDFLEIPNTDIIDWKTPEEFLLKNFICELYKTKEIDLQVYYELLDIIYQWKEVSEFIKTLPVFPNQNDPIQICKKSELTIDDGIPEEMKDSFDEIVNNGKPSIRLGLLCIKKDFSRFLIGGKTKTLKDVEEAINAEILKLEKDISAEKLMPAEKYQALITYCTITSQDKSKRRELSALICKYQNRSPDFLEIPNMIQDITPERCLLKNFIYELYQTKEIDLQVYYDLLSITDQWKEVSDIIETLPAFPNQDDPIQICKKSALEIDGGIPEEMKVLYDEIVNDGKSSIKSGLVYKDTEKDFSPFLINSKTKKPEDVGSEIERKLEKEHPLADINNHRFKKRILSIINRIMSNQWDKYFPKIDIQKKDIMFAASGDEETKDLMFGLMTNPDKMNLVKQISGIENLSESDIENMPEIIQLGKETLEKKEETEQLDKKILEKKEESEKLEKDILEKKKERERLEKEVSEKQKISQDIQNFSKTLLSTEAFEKNREYKDEKTENIGDVGVVKIKEWWCGLLEPERNEKIRKYYEGLFPSIPGFNLNSLKDAENDQYLKSWFILFAIAVFQQIGHIQDEQNKGFLEYLEEKKWLDTMVRTNDLNKWIDIYVEYFEGNINDQEYLQWMNYTLQLYIIREHIYTYIEWFESYQPENSSSIDAILTSQSNPWLSNYGWGLSAMNRTLKIGFSLIIRELLRNDVLSKEDEKIIKYAFMPKEAIRNAVFGNKDDRTSKEVYDEIRKKLELNDKDIFTFDDYYDIPILLYQRER